jgi:nuclear transport factor 2 (NTF2) superfamily protein
MSASDTTCWGCPGCGAVLTTRTAVAHVCGAGTGWEAENSEQAVVRPPQREYGGILAAAVVADIRPYAPEVCDSHENLRDAHAALTARLAAVEGERVALRVALEWAFDNGGWRLWYYADTPPPGVVVGPVGSPACWEWPPKEPTDGG